MSFLSLIMDTRLVLSFPSIRLPTSTSFVEVGADKASLGINAATAKTIKAISETLFLDSCFFKRSCRQDDFVNLNFRFVEY